MKKLSLIFAALSIILTNIMVAVIAYHYAQIEMCIKYAACSAPPSIAFVYVIPFGIAIIVCVLLSIHFKNK